MHIFEETLFFKLCTNLFHPIKKRSFNLFRVLNTFSGHVFRTKKKKKKSKFGSNTLHVRLNPYHCFIIFFFFSAELMCTVSWNVENFSLTVLYSMD